MTPQDSMQALTATSMRNVEAMQFIANASLNTMERMLALNIEFARASLDIGAKTAEPIAAVDWPAITARQRTGLLQAAETTGAWLRSAYDISSEAHVEIADLVSSQMDDLGESMTSMLGTLGQATPAGSEPAVAMLKSMIATTRSMYDQAVNATRQMTATGLASAWQPRQSTVELAVPATKAERKKAA